MAKDVFEAKQLKNRLRDIWISWIENRSQVPQTFPPSTVPLDIVIPCIEKDLAILPYVVDSAKAYVQHPIGQFYIVSPCSKAIKQFCIDRDCVFLDEADVLPLQKNDIHYTVREKDRSGWLFQQFLKFGVASQVEQPFYLVMDADTVLIRPHSFRYQLKTIFFYASYRHRPYFHTYQKLLNTNKTKPFSFVSHYMLFERDKVRGLCDTLEATSHKSWYDAIMSHIDSNENSFFSEYETYGNYVAAKFPDNRLFLPRDNISVDREKINQLVPLKQQHCDRYRSISFHNRE